MKYLVIIISIVFSSCGGDNIIQPRPHQYPRIEFPEQSFAEFSNTDCPFTMDIPGYADITKKKLLFGEEEADPCWFDLDMSRFNATVHCSYYAINEEYNFDKLVNDAFTMASKHNIKASFREEYSIKNKHNASGLIFLIKGPVATPFQFYMTDSTNHFLRGSLYFNDRVDIDSIAPVIDFIQEDLDAMLASIQWK